MSDVDDGEPSPTLPFLVRDRSSDDFKLILGKHGYPFGGYPLTFSCEPLLGR